MMRAILIALAALLGAAFIVVGGGYMVMRRGEIPYETLETRYAHPSSAYVQIGEVQVHFVETGPKDARTILLIHGFTASTHTWDAWAPILDERFHVVRLDLPGHGLTRAPAGYAADDAAMADLVARFMADRGFESAVVVGSSMGGRVAWRLALDRPQLVSALVLVGAAGWPEPSTGAGEPAALRWLENPLWRAIGRDVDNTAIFRQGLAASFADPRFADAAMVRRYAELSRAPGHRELLLRLALEESSWEDATPELLARIKAPTLVLHGEQDRLVPVEAGRGYVATIPGARGVFYPDAGHLPQEEIPARSAADLITFLNETALAAAPAPAGAPLTPAAPAPAALGGAY